VELNKTHTGDQFPEKHRVVSDGGRVTAGVVNGRGKATRALGVLSPGQVPHPDVRTVKLDPERVCVWPPSLSCFCLPYRRADAMTAHGRLT
jgi:hypothetical protein